MCGITGITPNNPEVFKKMNADLAHRGPDWTGVFSDERISIGHTLLAIRDAVSASKQPVADSPEWVLAFNGQIYNTRQMISRLENLDQAKIDSDTYVLYKTIEKYGWDFIDHIRGMFAIALYNRKEGIVRLYRDPSGQKVLYYHASGKDFVFASEIKALLEYPIERKADAEGLSVACAIGYIPGNKTLIAGIKKVRPSEMISFDLNIRALTRAFFKQEDRNYFPESPEDAFKQLVKEHLQSKAPVSINLSGGLDSSLLLHEMKELGREIHSYSTRFDINDGKINQDASLAKRLAKDYGATHTEILITKETFWQAFKDAYSRIEEPNYNISLPVYLLTARQEGIHGDKNRVILSGDGGDEIFGGYPAYKESLRFHKFERWLSPRIFSYLKNKRSNTDFNLHDKDERWLFFKAFSSGFLKVLNPQGLKDYIKGTTKDWAKLYASKAGPVYDLMIRDRILWMAGENFIRSDKLYMSESAEMRAPLAYSPFRAYIDALIPDNQYIGQTNKTFLRELYRGRLPDYIVDRKDKTGWRAPVSAWYDEKAKALFLEMLSSPYLTGEYIDWPSIRKNISKKNEWPGKIIHLYLSLAILADKYRISL